MTDSKNQVTKQNVTNDDLKGWALFYESIGLSVVPAIPDQKRPVKEWAAYQTDRPSREQVATWWDGLYKDHSIAIITGQVSGVFVVDIDEGPGKEGGETWDALVEKYATADDDLPHTWEAKTGGGGRHIFFRMPAGVIIKTGANVLGLGVDVRGDGGLVIAPPSRHQSGILYAWRQSCGPHEIEIHDAPQWLIDLVTNKAHQAAVKRLPGSGTGEIEVDWRGKVIDGRDRYMANIIWATLIDQLKECPIAPGVEEMFDLCWPVFISGVRQVGKDGRSLEEAGHTPEAMRAKIRSTLKPSKVDEAREAAKNDQKTTLPAMPDLDTGKTDSSLQERELEQIEPISDIAVDQADQADQVEPARPRLPGGVMSIADLYSLPDLQTIVDGLIADQSLAMIFGKFGSFKSFVALDMGLCMAHGAPWHGRETKQRRVLYVCGEGRHGIAQRVKAWHLENERDVTDDFLVLPIMPAILDEAAAQAFADTLTALEPRPGVIIIDTVARAMAGADENDTGTMGHFVAVCDHIRESLKASLIVVHHSGKADNGARGSTVLPAAADTEIKCEKVNDDFLRMTVTKQKDLDPAELPTFEKKRVVVGHTGAMGRKEIASIVLVPSEAGALATELPSVQQCRDLCDLVAEYWDTGNPLNKSPKDKTRYLPAVAHARLGMEERAAHALMVAWEAPDSGVIVVDQCARPSRKYGFRLVKYPGD